MHVGRAAATTGLAYESYSGKSETQSALAADCGRITGKPEVIPEDPIRAITSGWPTTRQLADSGIVSAMAIFRQLCVASSMKPKTKSLDCPLLLFGRALRAQHIQRLQDGVTTDGCLKIHRQLLNTEVPCR